MTTALLRVHRPLGLALGLLLGTIGLTGSLLVFHQALDERLNPELLATPGDSRRPLAEVVAAARAAVPEAGEPKALILPRHPSAMHTVRFSPQAPGAGSLRVTVDPYTGAVTSTREWGRYGTGYLYRLHNSLLAGRLGRLVVGLAGFTLLTMTFSGMWIWWRSRNTLSVAPASRARHGRSRRLHRWAGLGALPVLLTASVSGTYFVFPGPFHALLTTASTNGTSTAGRPSADSVDLDSALAVALQALPQAEPKRVLLTSGSYRVNLRLPGEPRHSNGLNTVVIDRATGTVSELHLHAARTPGEKFLKWLFPLHNGEAFGLTGRLVVAAVGLVPALLFVTGWRQRHRSAASARPWWRHQDHRGNQHRAEQKR